MGISVKVLALLAGGSMATLVLMAVVAHHLDTHGFIRNREAAATVTRFLAFALFLLFAYSVVPLAMHVFIVAQGHIGNGEVGLVRFLRVHERGVTFALWGVFTAGLLLALPVMWNDFFGPQRPNPPP